MDKVKMLGIYEEGYGVVAKKVMRDKTLNILSKAVYAYICSYTGKGKDAFPSQNLICRDLGIGKSTLVKYIKELKDRGYVTVIQHKEKGKFAQNLYTVNAIPCIVSSDTVETDTNPTARGQVNTNNNSLNNNKKNNNNIKDKKINNTHTEVEEKADDSAEHKNEIEKEKLSDAPMEIQDILKKYFHKKRIEFKKILSRNLLRIFVFKVHLKYSHLYINANTYILIHLKISLTHKLSLYTHMVDDTLFSKKSQYFKFK